MSSQGAIDNLLKPDQEILWQLYCEAVQDYHANPRNEWLKNIVYVTYKHWRKSFLNAAA